MVTVTVVSGINGGIVKPFIHKPLSLFAAKFLQKHLAWPLRIKICNCAELVKPITMFALFEDLVQGAK
jgi:hypothetical protein